MCWLYVPASLDWKPDSNSPSQALAQSVTWRGKPSPSLSRSPVFRKVISTMRRFGAMSKPSTASRGVEKWIASLEATRASPFPTQAVEKGQTIPDTSGPISGESSLKSNHDAASLKTWQTIFGSDLSPSGETFAIWTTRLRRESLRRQKLAHRISGSDCSYMPTLDSSGHKYRLRGNSQQSKSLEALARLGLIVGHPTGPLHPNYAEWLMGFPIGWTDLQPLATASYQQWQQQHGDNLERRR